MIDVSLAVFPYREVVAEHPLKTFRQDLNRQKVRYEPFKIEDYIMGVYDGLRPVPPRNASELLVRALTRRPNVFSDRDDEYAMLGIPRSIEAYMRYHRAEARLNTRDRMAVVIAPTGAGKSSINQVPIIELEAYTDQMDPAPVYGIVDCPINEEPLHVLDEKTRALWNESKGIEVWGQLCPSCRDRAEKSVQKNTLGFQMNAPLPLDFEVQALRFSLALGRGITRLEPSVYTESNASALMAKAILGSNRGILHIPELGQHPPDFIRALNDLLRGRKYSLNGRLYELDNVIIADMTLNEWEKLKVNGVNQSLIERIDEILVTYPLDPRAELMILQKRIATSQLENPPHFSPWVLKEPTGWAVRTRLVKYSREAANGKPAASLDEAKKAIFYSGQDVSGFTQLDRKVVEEAGRRSGEGTKGVSPPAIWKIVSKLIGEELSKAEEEGGYNKGCVNYIDLRKRSLDYIETSNYSDADKKRIKEQLESVVAEHDQQTLKTIEEAFYDNFGSRANKALRGYLEEVQPYLEKDKKKDPATEEERDPDEMFMRKFEDALIRGLTGEAKIEIVERDESIPDSERDKKMTRRTFRFRFNNRASKIMDEKNTDKQGNAIELVEYGGFPEYRYGFMMLLAADFETRKIGLPKDILKALTPTEEQAKEIALMEERLVRERGYCACCADIDVQHVQGQLRLGKLN